MAKPSAREIFTGGALLSLTALVMRTIGVGFNVYISDKIGAGGMGLLSLIMSVYSLSVTFAVSGISFGACRLVAEALGAGKKGEVRSAMNKCIAYSLAFGVSACALLLIFADEIAIHWLNEKRVTESIRIFAVSMPFISLSAAIGGYFTALRRVVKSASSQFFEQLVNISLTSFLLTLIAPKGIEYACMAIIAGGSVAQIASFLYSFILYKLDLKKNIKKDGNNGTGLARKLCRISLPIAFSAYIRTGLVTLEHLLIPRGLKKYGASSQNSLELYGVLQGMCLPIILFPTAFLSSFNSLLIPELARANAAGEKRRVDYIGERFLRFTLIFSIGTGALMLCFSHELGGVIYNSHTAADYIKVLAPLIPIMYFDTAVDSMLKGLDEQLFNMRINVIDAASSVVMVYFLCPRIGIMGYIVTIFASEIFNLSCSFVRLLNVTHIRVRLISWVVKPMLCAVCACTLVRIMLEAVRGIAFSYLSLFVHIILVLAVYLLLLVISATLGKEDLEWVRSLFLRK
ncbi:MAG: polysaccharide biosynthesis C-terminal domain-containing protein [Clostridia bacterium]|nr:polysaccharide biosynthesis C-terminal domain-containing protein [Clostridia bacterium]